MINQSITIQPWKSGGSHKNDTIWGALIGAGWTPRQIANMHLVQKVARMNHLKNPGLVHPGQKLVVPSPGSSTLGPASPGQGNSSAPATKPGGAPSGGIFGIVKRFFEGVGRALGG